jgi:hypothetical protein
VTELTPEQHDALAHWATFGRPGEPAAERWIPDAHEREKLHGFVAPESSTRWPDVLDGTQTGVLLRGVGWQEMEDKWVVYSDDPAPDGTTSVHLHRSWTGYEIVRVDLQLTSTGSRITRATWETDSERVKGGTEDFARSTFIEVCRWVLRMEPADEPEAAPET